LSRIIGGKAEEDSHPLGLLNNPVPGPPRRVHICRLTRHMWTCAAHKELRVSGCSPGSSAEVVNLAYEDVDVGMKTTQNRIDRARHEM
jgi:hypothetical protein